jgi:hypothetical protein
MRYTLFLSKPDTQGIYSAPIWCFRGLLRLTNVVVPIQLIFNDQTIDTRSVQIKLEGIIVEFSADDLLLIRNESNGGVTGAPVNLRFLPTAHAVSLGGSTFSAKFMTVFRLSLNKFHVYLAFQSLDKYELGKLKRLITEIA